MIAPTLLFDKSFLQSLSVDEAAVLDQLFCNVVCPIFFAETLGSLAKENAKRPPQRVVAELAEKTPVAQSYINSFHSRLVLHELLGMEVEMRGVPAVQGGTPVQVEGKAGLVFKKGPEAEAFDRWQRGQFNGVDRIVAGAWREGLGNLDLVGMAQAFKKALRKGAAPKSHDAARSLAAALVDAPGHNYQALLLAFGLLNIPGDRLDDVVDAWKARGRPPLRQYAPYTAYCLEVDLYFYLALANGLISDQRASNRIDIGYLYYLPFAAIFASGDKLHRQAAAHFLTEQQSFVWGPDLKADLADLNQHFLAKPEAEKAQGLFTLVKNPPTDHHGTAAELWDRHKPGWREAKPPIGPLSSEKSRSIIEQGKKLSDAARGVRANYGMQHPPIASMDSILFERHIPRQRGSWRMLSLEVEAAEDAHKPHQP